PGAPPSAYGFSRGCAAITSARVAPFGFDRLIARLQLPGHVSPLSASFFGRWPLGIRSLPLLAWHAIHHLCTCQSSRVTPTPRHKDRCDPLTSLTRLASAKLKQRVTTPPRRTPPTGHPIAHVTQRCRASSSITYIGMRLFRCIPPRSQS